MLRKVIEILMTVVLFILQVTVFKSLQIASISPDLLLILVVSLALMCGSREGLILGFISGLFIDLFFSSVPGFYTLIYMLIGFLMGFFSNEFFAEDIKLPLVLIAIGELFLNLLVYFFLFFFRGDFNFGYYMVNLIIPSVIYTVTVSVILYPLILLIHNKIAESERRSASKFG